MHISVSWAVLLTYFPALVSLLRASLEMTWPQISFMGGLLSDVCCLRIGQANTEWYQHFFPRSISICKDRHGVNQLNGGKEKWGMMNGNLKVTYRQLVFVRPDSAALSLLYHLLDVHQHRQGHTAWCKTAETAFIDFDCFLAHRFTGCCKWNSNFTFHLELKKNLLISFNFGLNFSINVKILKMTLEWGHGLLT